MDSRTCLGITTIQLYVVQDQGDYTRTALALRDDAHVGLHACAQGLYIHMHAGVTATRPVHSKNRAIVRACMQTRFHTATRSCISTSSTDAAHT